MRHVRLVPARRACHLPSGSHRSGQLRVESLESRRLLSATSLSAAPWLDAAQVTSSGHWLPIEPGVAVLDAGTGGGTAGGNDTATVTGMKWEDLNGDRQRGSDEPGLAGVVIYADLNQNREHDPDEPFTRSRADDPNTVANELGTYVLKDLPPGELVIREVVPAGYLQTFPEEPIPPAPEPGVPPVPPLLGGYPIVVAPGDVVEGLDFGNQRLQPVSVGGLKWLDENGNGEREATEPGLPGVVIYADLNFNRQLDEGEPRTVTREDDPDTNVDERGRYRLGQLEPGFLMIREVVPDGFVQTFPQPVTPSGGGPGLPPSTDDGAHVLVLPSGNQFDDANFGNQPIRQQVVHGRKWLDVNGNGQQDPGEPGLAGVVIYSDRNLNAVLDPGEPRTRTMNDIPETDFDETGLYRLTNLAVGPHIIREVVPDGFAQTFPSLDPNSGGPFPGSGAHFVILDEGGGADGIDFGNRRLEPPRGSVHGTKWLDRNGNGQREADEPGLPGVTIYADLNFNEVMDPGEPHTLTMRDNPNTDFDEAGLYWLELRAGPNMVREVVPDGFVQTYPISDAAVPFPLPGGHFVLVPAGGAIEGLDFGNQRVETGGSSVQGRKWLDENGDGQANSREPGLAGVIIYSDRNNNGMLDFGEPHTRTIRDIPETDFDEAGLYWLENLEPGRHVIREVVPSGFVQTFPISLALSPLESGAHFVELAPGQGVDGLDFGNQPTDVSADFDQDGDVDGVDFLAWQASFPIDSGASQADGDADFDGDVDGRDFLIWQRQFRNPDVPLEAAQPATSTRLRVAVYDAALADFTARPKRASLDANLASEPDSGELLGHVLRRPTADR